MHIRFFHAIVGIVLSCCITPVSFAADPVKLAVIVSLSGPFALSGQETIKGFQGIADLVNAKGGVLSGRKLEIVPLDGKANPQDSVLALIQAIDQSITFVATTTSSVTHALSAAIAQHNARNPERRVLLLDYDARDPALTEAKCNFWHFRFVQHTDTEMNFLTDYLASRKEMTKVHLINQDYAYGQSVSKAAKEMLAKKRPDIQIVGDDLIPLGKVKDFAPYVAWIRAADADSVITGNWGNDLFLLLKAGHQSGLNVHYYSLVPFTAGTATAIAGAGVDRLTGVFAWHANAEPNPYSKYNAEFKAKYKAIGNFDHIQSIRTVEMLVQAIDKALSTDALKVAYKLEGMHYNGPSGDSWMRAEDHQMIVPVYLANFVKAGQPGVKFDLENTGFGWKNEAKVEAKDAVPAMRCKMERPE